jgi:hypothetical protein
MKVCTTTRSEQRFRAEHRPILQTVANHVIKERLASQLRFRQHLERKSLAEWLEEVDRRMTLIKIGYSAKLNRRG